MCGHVNTFMIFPEYTMHIWVVIDARSRYMRYASGKIVELRAEEECDTYVAVSQEVASYQGGLRWQPMLCLSLSNDELVNLCSTYSKSFSCAMAR